MNKITAEAKAMNPEVEARRLIDKYLKVIKERTDVFNAYSDLSFAKECASVCAERNEELIYAMPINNMTFYYRKEKLQYWKEVVEVIKKVVL